MSERVLVTGGAGFIGSHLSHKLVELGYDVVIIDNLVRGNYDYIKDLADRQLRDRGENCFCWGDIRTPELLHKIVKGCKYVFHLAAVCINYSVAHPQESLEVNVQGTYNVLDACLKANVEKIVFASSASVYGNPIYLPMNEEHPLRPLTPYCVAKIAGEQLLRMFSVQGVDYVAFRNFNVYGPHQSTDAFYTSVIIKFIEALSKGESAIIYGDGTQSMDFVYVDDVVDAYIRALDANVHNEIINLGSGESTSIRKLHDLISSELGVFTVPTYRPSTNLLVRKRQADISKAYEHLGWKPKTKLPDGLNQIIQHNHKVILYEQV